MSSVIITIMKVIITITLMGMIFMIVMRVRIIILINDDDDDVSSSRNNDTGEIVINDNYCYYH